LKLSSTRNIYLQLCFLLYTYTHKCGQMMIRRSSNLYSGGWDKNVGTYSYSSKQVVITGIFAVYYVNILLSTIIDLI